MPKQKKSSTKSSDEIEFKVGADQIVKKVKKILEEGNARRIIIKNNKGTPVMEIPVTVGVVGTLLAPYLAAVGALAAVLTNCTIVVKKK